MDAAAVGSPVPVPTPLGGNEVDCGNTGSCSCLTVIAHGWNDSIHCNEDDHWTSSMSACESQSAPDCKLIGYDWQDAANPGGAYLDTGAMAGLIGAASQGKWPLNVYQAYRNAQSQGKVLADIIQQERAACGGPQNLSDVRLIGHSFGGVVVGEAARILYSRYGIRIGEIVIIDTPQLPGLGLPATSHVDPGSANHIINVYGCLPSLAVGGPIDDPRVTNYGVDLDGRGLNGVGHSELPELWCELKDRLRSYTPGSYHEVYDLGSNTPTVVTGPPACTFGFYVSPITFASQPIAKGIGGWLIEQLNNTTGHNVQCVLVGDQLAAELNELNEGPPFAGMAQFYQTVTIPLRAQYMQFQYAIPGNADGDELIVSFNDTVLYDLPLWGTQSTFTVTTPIYVGDLVGQTGQFIVTLTHNGQPGAKVQLNQLKFYDVSSSAAPDLNGDQSADGTDLALFIGCASGPAMLFASGCDAADFDHDGDVDQSDFGIFQRCYSGEGISVDPNCAD